MKNETILRTMFETICKLVNQSVQLGTFTNDMPDSFFLVLKELQFLYPLIKKLYYPLDIYGELYGFYNCNKEIVQCKEYEINTCDNGEVKFYLIVDCKRRQCMMINTEEERTKIMDTMWAIINNNSLLCLRILNKIKDITFAKIANNDYILRVKHCPNIDFIERICDEIIEEQLYESKNIIKVLSFKFIKKNKQNNIYNVYYKGHYTGTLIIKETKYD